MSEEEPQSTCDECDPRGQQKVAWCQQEPKKLCDNAACCCTCCAQRNRAAGTFSGGKEGSFQEVPGYSF